MNSAPFSPILLFPDNNITIINKKYIKYNI